MEEYVWISKMAHQPVYTSRVHPVLHRLASIYNVKMSIAGPDGLEKKPYVKAIRQAVQRRVTGIMIVGWDDENVITALNQAIDSGIPVVSVDHDIPGSKSLSHVGPNWFRMGSDIGERLALLIEGCGKTLLIGMGNKAGIKTGMQGYQRSIGACSKIEILGPELAPDAELEKIESIVIDYLNRHSDLNGIAAFDGVSGTAAAMALEKSGRDGSVKLVCVDGEATIFEHLKRGSVNAVFYQKRETAVYMAFQILHAYHHGTELTGYTPGIINIPANIDSGYMVVSEKNLDSFERELGVDASFERFAHVPQPSLLASILDNLESLVLAVDAQGRIVYANPGGIKQYGYAETDVIGRLVEDVFALSGAHQKLLKHCLLEAQVASFETSLTKKDGSALAVLISISPRKSDATSHGLAIIAVDISALKKVIEEQAHLVTAVEHTAEAIIVTDTEGTIRYVNPAFEQITGYLRAEVTGQSIRMLESDQQDPSHYQKIWDCFRQGELWHGRFISRRKDDIEFESELTISPIKDDAGRLTHFVCVQRDMTYEIALQRQLRQAQKMEAVGTLAGGIAHDFNNLLMGIQGNISLSLLDLDDDSPVYENLSKVKQFVQNGVDLTKQLLGFARGGKYEVTLTDINALIEDQNLMFSRTNKEFVFQTDFDPNLWSVEVDRGQIEQVMLNLYMNAIQAMPGGGTLTIGTRNVRIDRNQYKPYRVRAGKYVKITVADTGIGMDKETQRRIFEPFFTTKEMGRGTGLGLASVYGIIKNHEGFIEVFSRKGKGTRFEFYLPASEREAPKKETPSEKFINVWETILLVDDEDMILDVGKRMLTRLGYAVLTAEDGFKALEIYRKNQDAIDMVILDMVMPNIGGGETFERLKQINPDIRVLLSSGFSITGQAAEILSRGCQGFIQKPFTLQGLSRSIRAVMDKK